MRSANWESMKPSCCRTALYRGAIIASTAPNLTMKATVSNGKRQNAPNSSILSPKEDSRRRPMALIARIDFLAYLVCLNGAAYYYAYWESANRSWWGERSLPEQAIICLLLSYCLFSFFYVLVIPRKSLSLFVGCLWLLFAAVVLAAPILPVRFLDPESLAPLLVYGAFALVSGTCSGFHFVRRSSNGAWISLGVSLGSLYLLFDIFANGGAFV